jgi:archaeal flagellar protein FlaJ
MGIELKDKDLIGAGIAVVLIAISYFVFDRENFPIFAGIGILIAVLPIILRINRQNTIEQEKEEMFLEFARNLVESVKTGTPISKSIVNMAEKNYGHLTLHIKKLANQISIGIPLNKALRFFVDDVNNNSISRALTLIGQAERAGGDIGEILESVAGAVNMADKLKKERKASISTLVVQGYIIFLVFIVIILIMQFQIIPMVSGMGDIGGSLGFGGGGLGSGGGAEVEQEQISNAFLYLILVQGFFTGLIIGKLAEGNVKAGVKHSFALMVLSFMISTIANIIFG